MSDSISADLWSSRRRCLALLTLALFGLGCGRSDLPPMADAYGTLTLDGQPLPDAIISFTPKSGGRPSQAISDAQGEFQMGTFEVGDGALVGEHSVAINPKRSPPPAYVINPKRATGYKPPFPDHYWSPNSSGFQASVKAGEDNEFSFELTSSVTR